MFEDAIDFLFLPRSSPSYSLSTSYISIPLLICAPFSAAGHGLVLGG
jgi:hypothetical protein